MTSTDPDMEPVTATIAMHGYEWDNVDRYGGSKKKSKTSPGETVAALAKALAEKRNKKWQRSLRQMVEKDHQHISLTTIMLVMMKTIVANMKKE
jgi:hypothetical protein